MGSIEDALCRIKSHGLDLICQANLASVFWSLWTLLVCEVTASSHAMVGEPKGSMPGSCWRLHLAVYFDLVFGSCPQIAHVSWANFVFLSSFSPKTFVWNFVPGLAPFSVHGERRLCFQFSTVNAFWLSNFIFVLNRNKNGECRTLMTWLLGRRYGIVPVE